MCSPDFDNWGGGTLALGQYAVQHLNISATTVQWLFQNSKTLVLPIIQGQIANLTLHYHPSDRSVRMLKGEMKQDGYRLIADRLRDRGAMLDMGTHIGVTALMYAVLHPLEKIFAFEPTPYNFFYAAWNIGEFYRARARRSVPNIQLHNAGLSSSGKDVLIEYSPDDSMSSKVDKLGRAFGRLPKQHFRVRTVSLRKLLTSCEMPAIGVVKLDCEGCEFDVVPDNPAFFGSLRHRIVGEYHSSQLRSIDQGGIYSEEAISRTRRVLCGRLKLRSEAQQIVQQASAEDGGIMPSNAKVRVPSADSISLAGVGGAVGFKKWGMKCRSDTRREGKQSAVLTAHSGR